MKLKRLLSTAALIIASSISQAEIKSFEAKNINSYSSNIYPTLDLNSLDQIKITANQIENPDTPFPTVDIKSVEFEFSNANNLIVENFSEVADTPFTYRAVVTSPWVFKKVFVELSPNQPFNGINFNYRVLVMDNSSNINDLENTLGLELFSGDAELVNVSERKVVDAIHGRRYLNKPLTLRLLNNTSPEGVQIEATWFGHGTKILTLPSTFYPRLSPVALILKEQRIKVRFDDAYNGPESSEEDIHVLLEQAFGPLPDPEAPAP